MMKKLRSWVVVPVAAWVALTPAVTFAKGIEESEISDLIEKELSSLFEAAGGDQRRENEKSRYIPGPDRAVLQTPCYRFIDGQGRKIELTGAIHIAEKPYYEALNKRFESFDAVLFEGVGSEEAPAQPGAKPAGEKQRLEDLDEGGDLSEIYRFFAHDLLGISCQKDVMNYNRPNFIHADLSERELDQLLKEAGISNLDELLLKGSGIKKLEDVINILPLIKASLPKDDPKALMRIMMPLFADAESPQNEDDKLRTEIIVVRRNDRVLEVLDKQLVLEKKNVAIFYGAGHLPDLRKRLIAKGWKEEGCEWLDAWVVPAKPATSEAPAPAPAPGETKAKGN